MGPLIYDFFIAHAGHDEFYAVRLYELLSPYSRVFLDAKSLVLGDDWDQRLSSAQRQSLVTVVLVSSSSDGAYYEREEIAAAISMARSDAKRHRVVPIFLDPLALSSESIPYGLRLKHGLTLSVTQPLDRIAQSLLELKKKLEVQTSSQGDESISPSEPVPDKLSPKIGTLGYWHFALILLVPLLYMFLRQCSEPGDPFRSLLETAAIVLPVLWISCLIVFYAREGPLGDWKEKLIGTYRRLLTNSVFVLTTNVFLTAAATGLLFLLLDYRQMEIVSEVQAFAMRDAGCAAMERLALLKPNETKKVRLRVGTHHLLFTDITNSPLDDQNVTVPFVWQARTLQPIIVSKQGLPSDATSTFDFNDDATVKREWDGPALSNKGDLLVPARAPVYLTKTGFSPQTDFTTDFEFRLRQDQKTVGWIVRANKQRPDYYEFSIDLQKERPAVEARIIRCGKIRGETVQSDGLRLPRHERWADEVLQVHFIAQRCTFTTSLAIRPPPPEAAVPINVRSQFIIGDDSYIPPGPYPERIALGNGCVSYGQFGFLSDDSERVITHMKLALNAQ